jgi:uncharacterized membrane protein
MRAILAPALIPLGLTAVFAALVAAPIQAQPQPAGPKPEEFKKTIQPFINKYCIKCHEGPKAEDGVDFAKYKTHEDVLKDTRTWRKSGRQVKSKNMPPEDKLQPKKAEADAFVKWTESLPRPASS